MEKLKLKPNNKKYYSDEFIKGFECGVERQFNADMSENTTKQTIEELENIKAEIYRHHNITCNFKCATCFLEYNCELHRKIDLLEDLAIIDKHISELKGENNEI